MNEYESEIELYDYIEVLLEYKWFILVATLFCGGLGWIMRPEAPPPLYEADVVLMIKQLPSQQAAADDQQATPATQSSGFYEALARDDGLKQALVDSLDLKMSLTVMDGLLQVQVLDPGVRLTVRHSDPALPIPLVNAWATLFVARNSDLNSEEGGRYYDYVENQYQTTRDRLDSTELALHAFESANKIGFLQIQQTTLDSATIVLYQRIVDLESALLDTSLMIQTSNIQLHSIIAGFRPTYQRIIEELQHRNTTTSQELLYDKVEVVLRRFDEETQFPHWANLYAQLEIDNLEKELAKHPPALGNAPNPLYIELSKLLNELRMEHGDPSGNRGKAVSESFDLTKGRKLYAELRIQRNRIKVALNLIVQIWVNKMHLHYMEKLQYGIGDSLSVKMRDHQRLFRNQKFLIETLDRISTLAEGARISRAKSASNIRILTQALEVRQISREPAQQKAAIAAGVGFLISSILSLLVEYMRKAKARRSEAGSE